MASERGGEGLRTVLAYSIVRGATIGYTEREVDLKRAAGSLQAAPESWYLSSGGLRRDYGDVIA